MDKVNELLLHSSMPVNPNDMVCKTYFDSPLHISDKRIAQLSLLLLQLCESLGALEAVPQPELFEIVTCAVSLCGFANTVDTLDVIAYILDSLQAQHPRPESPLLCDVCCRR